MSAAEKNEFVIKHVFTDVMNIKGYDESSYKEKHLNIPWQLSIYRLLSSFGTRLECPHFRKSSDGSIKTEIDMKLFNKKNEKLDVFKHKFQFFEWRTDTFWIREDEMEKYLDDGNLTIQCHVKIIKTTAMSRKLKNFDEESMKEFSDVVLIVNDCFMVKFYVCKMHLASHSSYFKSLFYGDPSDAQKSEFILNDIHSAHFQNFLELIHGESEIDDYTVYYILKLAVMFDSKTAIRRCEEFLIEKSNDSLKEKFKIAVSYKLERLKNKCLSEMKTAADVLSVVPEDSNELDSKTWKKLLLRLASFQ